MWRSGAESKLQVSFEETIRIEEPLPTSRGFLRSGLRFDDDRSLRVEDGGCDVGLFEVAVLGGDDDLSCEEEEHVDFELAAEGDGEPHAVGLRSVDGGEADAGDVGAEQDAYAERQVAGERGSDDDGLKGGRVDPGVALPRDFALVLRMEFDVEGVAAVAGLAAAQGEGVVGLLF